MQIPATLFNCYLAQFTDGSVRVIHSLMKSKFPFLFLFFFAQLNLYAQHMGSTYTNVVFPDNVNLRVSPSLASPILGTLPQKASIHTCDYERWIADTISGVIDHWVLITYKNLTGYIWRPILADGYFKSELNTDNLFLIDFSSKKELLFKVFAGDSLTYLVSFDRKKHKEIVGSTSFGKTFNSSGNEVIAISYEDDSYELFEWNGSIILESKIKLNDESFINQKYHDFKLGFINKEGVNVRSAPNANAAIVETLPALTRVEIVKINHTEDILNKERGYCHCICS